MSDHDLFAENGTRRHPVHPEVATLVEQLLAERDTLRQQLAVAREGLEEICDYKEKVQIDDWDMGWNDGRGEAADTARATIAKLDQMGEKP